MGRLLQKNYGATELQGIFAYDFPFAKETIIIILFELSHR